ARHLEVLRAADRRHVRPGRLRDLDREGAHAAAGPVDQDPLPRFQLRLVAQALQGRVARSRHGRGLLERHVARFRGQSGLAARRIFREAAATLAEHFIAGLETRHVLADGLDRSCDVCPADGVFGRRSPSDNRTTKKSADIMCQSNAFTDAARTFTSTRSSGSTGFSISRSRSTSGGPYRSCTKAFIVPSRWDAVADTMFPLNRRIAREVRTFPGACERGPDFWKPNCPVESE